MKKSFPHTALSLFISLLAIGVIVISIKTGDGLFFQINAAETSKTERLLRDLGFLPHPDSNSAAKIKLLDLSGHEFSLSDFRGKVVFLNFWTTWCSECRIEMPAMEKLHQKFKDANFVMVTVNIKESRERVKDFFKKYRLTFTGLLDPAGDLSSEMRIRALPTTFIIDKDGSVLGVAMGSRKWNSKKAHALFKHLVN